MINWTNEVDLFGKTVSLRVKEPIIDAASTFTYSLDKQHNIDYEQNHCLTVVLNDLSQTGYFVHSHSKPREDVTLLFTRW